MIDEYENPQFDFRRFITENVTSVNSETKIPGECRLNQKFTNLFNPAAVISFTLPEDSHVGLSVCNLLRQFIVRLSDDFKGRQL